MQSAFAPRLINSSSGVFSKGWINILNQCVGRGKKISPRALSTLTTIKSKASLCVPNCVCCSHQGSFRPAHRSLGSWHDNLTPPGGLGGMRNMGGQADG